MPYRARSLASTWVSTHTAPFDDAVGAAALAAAHARDRAMLTIAPPPRVLHQPRRRARDDEGADHVDVEDLAEQIDRRVQRLDVGGDAGRVDDAVEPAQRLAQPWPPPSRPRFSSVTSSGASEHALGAAELLARRLPAPSRRGRRRQPSSPPASNRRAVASPMPDAPPVMSATDLALAMACFDPSWLVGQARSLATSTRPATFTSRSAARTSPPSRAAPSPPRRRRR